MHSNGAADLQQAHFALCAGVLCTQGRAGLHPQALAFLFVVAVAYGDAVVVRGAAVGDLDYLIKGGRIGKVTGRAANMLGIKPMILFKDGEIFSGGVARGRQKSFEKALEQLMR